MPDFASLYDPASLISVLEVSKLAGVVTTIVGALALKGHSSQNSVKRHL